MAVAKGMVDGASVDGLIWEYYHQRKPSVTARTRIIKKSEEYGIPPLVASRTLPSDIKKAVIPAAFFDAPRPPGPKNSRSVDDRLLCGTPGELVRFHQSNVVDET